MKNRLTMTIVAALLVAACHGRTKSVQREQQQYNVVQEGQSSGVTSTISAPGELPPLTATNADTTSNFTLAPNIDGTGTLPPGTIAGTMPPMPSYPPYPTTAPRPAPRPQPPPVTEPQPQMSSAPPPTDTTNRTSTTGTTSTAPPPPKTDTTDTTHSDQEPPQDEPPAQQEPPPTPPPTTTDTQGQ